MNSTPMDDHQNETDQNKYSALRKEYSGRELSYEDEEEVNYSVLSPLSPNVNTFVDVNGHRSYIIPACIKY